MRNRLKFKLSKTKNFGALRVLYDKRLAENFRKDSGLIYVVKSIGWPFLSLRNYWLVDGFIEREIGKLIKKYLNRDSVFLEVGCGDMGLKRYLPKDAYYNAFDISLSEFFLMKASRDRKRINIALCSAEEIPLASNTASLIVSTEVLEHIRNIDKAMKEIRRVLKKDGFFIVSIPNNYCHKYRIKGPHEDHINNWTFEGFRKYVESAGFKTVESFMRGYWIPISPWLTPTSYQLPIASKKEYFNTNFFYVFQKSA